MSGTERRIGDYLLEHGDRCKELLINGLSQRTGARVATIGTKLAIARRIKPAALGLMF